MQEVQALTRFGVPFTTARTVWMFGFQRRLVRRCECEMLWPKPGPLPHTSQLAATSIHLYRVVDAAGGYYWSCGCVLCVSPAVVGGQVPRPGGTTRPGNLVRVTDTRPV